MMDEQDLGPPAHWKLSAGRDVIKRLVLCWEAKRIDPPTGAARWTAISVVINKEDIRASSLSTLLQHYPRGHPLHTLAAMAAQFAEHPAILLIEVVLTPDEDPLLAELLMRVEPAVYPMTGALRRFARAVEVATGIEFIAALPAKWQDESAIGYVACFGPVPA